MVILIAIGVAIIIIIGFALNTFKVKSFGNLAARMGATVTQGSIFSSAYSMEGKWDGEDFSMRYSAGSRNNPDHLKITLCGAFMADFSIWRESFLDRAEKAMHLERDMEIGNQKFDQKYFVRAHNETSAKTFLMNQDRRAIVDALFDHPSMDQIDFQAGTATVQLSGALLIPSGNLPLVAPVAKKILENLSKLSEE